MPQWQSNNNIVIRLVDGNGMIWELFGTIEADIVGDFYGVRVSTMGAIVGTETLMGGVVAWADELAAKVFEAKNFTTQTSFSLKVVVLAADGASEFIL
ncbi:hypothetical protein ACH5RR_015475 [Cinchona calisaya]|uniref:Uncharacterized protein n=1 Tax=Cinchona calisaya TaxID=153742 RepID=A0ABD2ZV49_9GENT